MIRHFLPLIALPLAVAGVASTTGSRAEVLDFNLQEQGDGSIELAANFSRPGERHSQWNTRFAAAELDGLDIAGLHAGDPRPLRFAMMRESGHLDCAGTGSFGRASGRCNFAAEPAFAAMLAEARVTGGREDWLSMFAVDVRGSLVVALRDAGYPPPTFDQLIELTAVGANADYIRAMAAAGYRPKTLDSLVEMRAVGVTPEWIAGFARLGLGAIDADELVELRALGIDADYVQSMRAAGYPNLKPEDLVELKALGVTADYARQVERHMGRQPPDRLVELKALGVAFRN